jgi:phage shock protein A
MTKFKSVTEWLSTNPDVEEQTKVLNLINRGESHRIRKAIYEKERYLKKLNSLSKDYTSLEIKVPKDVLDAIKNTNEEISNMKKDLPIIPKRSSRAKTKQLVEEKVEE